MSNKVEKEMMFSTLSKSEVIEMSIRHHFVLNGYRQYKMSNFENYELYHEHRDFLKNTNIITFTDGNGKLKALKPDVTMSIIKHTTTDEVQSKLFYVENVFRTAPNSGDIKEIKQMGVEYIGATDLYSVVEILKLATTCLSIFSDDYILNINNISFVTDFIDTLSISGKAKDEIIKSISEKNAHTVSEIAEKEKCSKEQVGTLVALTTTSGKIDTVLDKISKHISSEKMKSSYDALFKLCNVLKSTGIHQNIRIDFSTLSPLDAKYYNGIIFQGFIKGTPSAVLTGGRYDNLMQYFDKPQSAVGFAIQLSDVLRSQPDNSEYDVDVAIIYDEKCDIAHIIKKVEEFQQKGKCVNAICKNKLPLTLKAEKEYYLDEPGEIK